MSETEVLRGTGEVRPRHYAEPYSLQHPVLHVRINNGICGHRSSAADIPDNDFINHTDGRWGSCQLEDTQLVGGHAVSQRNLDRPSGIYYIVPIVCEGYHAVRRTDPALTQGLVLYSYIKKVVT